jgi:multidrug efflux system membrane fusion protein
LIPVAAIQRNAKGAFVYVIKSDSTASLQNITVGTTDGNTSAVQGIQPDAVVATTGFDKLQEGAKVAVHNNPPNGAGSGQNANADGTSNKSPDASAGNSTRGSAPGSKQSDSATPNTSTSSSGSHP